MSKVNNGHHRSPSREGIEKPLHNIDDGRVSYRNNCFDISLLLVEYAPVIP